MSTVRRRGPDVLPPLEEGQRLDQPTFHARYEAMPPETRAELIGGVVHMSSPLSIEHGGPSRRVTFWLCYYQMRTRGLGGEDNVTVILGNFGELQPDCILRIPEASGGLSRVNEDRYLVGPPELVAEVARSSLKIDLGDKKKDYLRAGVPEYLVIEIGLDRVHWFLRRPGRYVQNPPGPDGVFRSTVFPGLWLNAPAFFAGDLAGLIETLDRGLATPEHAEFAARLARDAGGV
jgi:Uma2 family endonuclease